MGNKPDVPFGEDPFTKRFAAHSRVAYYPYPRHASCRVLVPFVVDQLLIGKDAFSNPHVREALLERAEPIESVFGEGGPSENEVQIWQLRDVDDDRDFPDVAHFIWSLRDRVLEEHKIDRAQVAPNHVLIPAGDYHQCPAGPPEEPPERGESPETDEAKVRVAVIDSGWEESGPAQTLVVGHAYAEWLAALPGGGFAWAPTVAASMVVPAGSPGAGRLAALTAHANFIVGVIADACPSAGIYVESHNALFVEAAAADPGIPTEAAVARSLWNRRRNDLIHVGFAFPTLPDSELTPENAELAGPPSWALQVVLDALPRKNPPYIVAPAGNQSCTIPQYPAAFGRNHPNVIGVGSIDDAGGRSDFSNHGDWVKCCTGGEDVLSTFIDFTGETEESEPVGNPHPNKTFQGWATWSGTSFSSPKITGRLAAEHVATPGTVANAWANLAGGATPPNPAVDMGLIFP